LRKIDPLKIELLAVGTRSPGWVAEGFEEYRRRLPGDWRLDLSEIQAAPRRKGEPVKKFKNEEGDRMLGAVKTGSRIVSLDNRGSNWSTETLAEKLQTWQFEHGQIQLLVGGPDGLSDECLERADDSWSLSGLTFPHFIVRILIAEQIYRAWSIINNHPYHK